MDRLRTLLPLPLLLTFATLAGATLTLEPTFTSCSVYFPSAIRGECVLSYRKANDPQWRPALAPIYDLVNQEYRGSIVRLDENTRYEVRLELQAKPGSPVVASGTVTTWTSTPTVETVRKLSSFTPATGNVFEFSGLKGKPDAWIKIVGDVPANADASRDYAMKLDGCEYVIIEGLTLKGGYKHALLITESCSNIRIVNGDISQWGRVPQTQNELGEFIDRDGGSINHDAGIYMDRARNVVVERCYIHDPNGYTNPWRGTIQLGPRAGQRFSRTHPKGPNGIYIRQAGGGIVLRYNDIVGSHAHRYNDPVETASNGAVDGGFNRDADIYGNVMAFGEDDGIELDGGQCNVRMFDNRIEQVLCGISTAPNKKGPSYIFDNLVWNLGDSTGSVGAAIKNGGGVVHSIGRQFFFNNTFISSGYGCMQAVGFGDRAPESKGGMFHATTRNNIFLMIAPTGARAANVNRGPSIGDTFKVATNSFDYDMVANNTLPGGKGVMVAAEGNESHGVFASPSFVNPVHGVFTLQAGDPGIDRGVVVPNFTETYAGQAPDIGALEKGASSLLPIRPLAISADKYFVQLKAGESGTVVLKVGKVGGMRAFTIRQAADMEWLTVQPTSGPITDNGSISIRLVAGRLGQPQKGMIFLRLEDGFSVPITVSGAARQTPPANYELLRK